MQFGRGLDQAKTDRFVGMYVNELTLDTASGDERPCTCCSKKPARKGLIPKVTVEFA